MSDYPMHRRGAKPPHDAEAAMQRSGLTLPPPPSPLASYVAARRAGDLLYVSGQLPMRDGQLLATGPVPSATSAEAATQAARQCVLNALAAAKAELGDLAAIRSVLRVGVFVHSDDGFGGQSIVANGASDLLVELFGDVGRHARVAVGVNALPLNAAVEVEITFAL